MSAEKTRRYYYGDKAGGLGFQRGTPWPHQCFAKDTGEGDPIAAGLGGAIASSFDPGPQRSLPNMRAGPGALNVRPRTSLSFFQRSFICSGLATAGRADADRRIVVEILDLLDGQNAGSLASGSATGGKGHATIHRTPVHETIHFCRDQQGVGAAAYTWGDEIHAMSRKCAQNKFYEARWTGSGAGCYLTAI